VLAKSLTNKKFECGTDEAGRGCLAGPVTAAAVILPKKFENQTINDSKIVSESKRIKLKEIIENKAISFGVSHVDNNKIDQINILNASIFAMHNAISKLQNVSFISVDGNRFKSYKKIPYQTVVKGDSLYLNIAAASILAKTYRDNYMNIIHEEFPMYNWKKNKGYPTKEHRDAIKKYGVSKYHRRSFKLLPNQLNFEF
jgi:ribonuclease HII